MIAEHAEKALSRADMGEEAAQVSEARGDGAVGHHSDVAADQAEINLKTLEMGNECVGKTFESIQMKISEEEDAKLVKGGRQRRKTEGFFDHLDLEGIALPLRIKAGYPEEGGEEDLIGKKAAQVKQRLPAGKRTVAGPPFPQAYSRAHLTGIIVEWRAVEDEVLEPGTPVGDGDE